MGLPELLCHQDHLQGTLNSKSDKMCVYKENTGGQGRTTQTPQNNVTTQGKHQDTEEDALSAG